MKVTVVGHASILIEAKGVRVLSDPWWRGPCFGAQWWQYPEPFLEAIRERHPDYVYVSHGHHDHFHPTTLKSLSRNATVLVAAGLGLAAPLRGMGFAVMELPDRQEVELAPGLSVRIVRTDGDDSLMVLSDGIETCVNINDALHSSPRPIQAKFAAMLRAWYPRLDYVFCGYGVASHFPNCYLIPGKDRERTAANRQRHFNRAWATIVNDLSPRFGFPFAADLVFLEDDLFWSNEPTHNAERPTEAFRQMYGDTSPIVLDIAPGFTIEDGQIVSNRLRQPIVGEQLQQVFGDVIPRVNRPPTQDQTVVAQLRVLLEQNIRTCEPYLASYAGDYRCLIRFRNTDGGVAVTKRGARISVAIAGSHAVSTGDYDLVYSTRVPYLHKSLTSEHGHEILFVGSGGIFEYPDASTARRNVHRELSVIMRRMSACPEPRPTHPGWVANAKRVVKQLIEGPEDNLYDLTQWTILAR